MFNCQNWLATDEDDGQISRELIAINPSVVNKIKLRPGCKNLREHLMLETERKYLKNYQFFKYLRYYLMLRHQIKKVPVLMQMFTFN